MFILLFPAVSCGAGMLLDTAHNITCALRHLRPVQLFILLFPAVSCGAGMLLDTAHK